MNMANMNPAINILVVTKNPSITAAARKALEKKEGLNLIKKKVTSDNLFPLLTETQPDVILFDFAFQNNPVQLLKKIAANNSNSTLVAILSESEMVDSDKAAEAGVRDSVMYPSQFDNLPATIENARISMKKGQAPSSQIPVSDADLQSQETITVFSPKGGVGTTTIAVNLAISIHKNQKEDVLLIDGKHLFGHIALFCNIRTGNSMSDLIAHVGMLDERLIKQVAVRHTSGIHVLPSPNSVTGAQGIRPENLYKVIQSLQQVFPHIVIDGGNDLNENTVTYMDASSKVLLVLNPDLASMRDAKQFVQIAETLSYPEDKTMFILNLTGRKTDVKGDEIEKILKTKIFGKIPSDENLAINCLNEGVPIILKKPHHAISKAYTEIAKELIKITENAKT